MSNIRSHLSLYLVMGSMNCFQSPEDVLEAAIRGGVTLFQYREKGAGALQGNARIALGKRFKKICSANGIPFIVNDNLDLALQLEADGVHIGQEDCTIQEARRKLGTEKWVGVSAHNVEEAEEAATNGANYLGVGPMYPTTTKSDCREVRGPSVLRQIRSHLPLMPLVGIGGISPSNFTSVLEAGADGIAVVSAISKAADPREAAGYLRIE